MFYDRFIYLCKKRGVSPSAVMVAIGLNKSNATFWKKGSMPKAETVQKLADYFGVSVDYLLGNTDNTERAEKKPPAPAIDDINFALFGGAEDFTPEEWEKIMEDVRTFAKYVIEQKKKRKE